MRRLPLLVLLLALLHACLALGFAQVTPWRTAGTLFGHRALDIGAPDEYAHANYVRHLLRGEGLPVLDPKHAAPDATYEDHQPPLFYLLDAGFAHVFGVADVEAPGAKLALRVPNVLIGAATVVATFLLVFWASDRPRLALGAAALVAVLPMNAALSGAVSNDPLLYLLCTAILALGARQLRQASLANAVGIGVLTGLATLTKFTGLLFVVMIPFFVKDRRQLVLSWALAAVVAGPYLVRNENVYGNPLALNAFHETFERTVDLAKLHTPRGLLAWVHVLVQGTAESMVGRFGYMDIPLPAILLYPLLLLVAFGVFLGLRLPSAPLRFRYAAATFSLLLLLSFASYNLWQLQTQGRYLFPAIGLLAFACGEGYRRKGGVALLAVLLVGLLFADGYALATLPSSFAARMGGSTS